MSAGRFRYRDSLRPPRGAGPLIISDLFNTIGTALFVTGYTLFLTRGVGLSIVQTSVLLTVAGVLSLITTLPLGHLADRLGPREVSVALLALRAAATLGLVLWPTVPVLYVCTALVQIGDRGLHAALGALTAAIGGRARVRLQAYLRSATNVGLTTGSLLATPFLAAGSYGAYVTLLMLHAGVVAAAALVLLRTARVPPVRVENRKSILTATKDRRYLAVTGLHGVLALQYEVLAYALPLWIVYGTDAPHWLISVLFATSAVLVAVLQVPMANAAATVTAAAVLGRRSGAVFLVSTALFGSAHFTHAGVTVAVLYAAVLVHTLGELWQAASSFALSFELADEDAHGQYQAMFALGRGVERAVAPVLLGELCLRWARRGGFCSAPSCLWPGTGCRPRWRAGPNSDSPAWKGRDMHGVMALMGDLRVELVRTINDVDPAAWNGLSGASSFYLSHDWLGYVEGNAGADVYYLLVRSHGQLAGALPLYLVRHESNVDYMAGRIFSDGLPGRFLLAGTRRGYVNEVLVDPTLDESRTGAVLATLLDAAGSLAGGLGLDGVLFLYLSGHAASALHHADPTTRPLLHGVDTAIPVVGERFEDYLCWLGSRRAYQVRKEMRIFAEAGYEVGVERLGDCWYESGPLVANVQQRYGHDEDAAACRESLRAQADRLDPHSVVFTARRRGALVALSLFYAWRKTLHGRLVGFDYQALTNSGEYFNLLFYQPLIWAYLHRFRCVHLGRESYPAKLGRGARPRSLFAVAVPGAEPAGGWLRWNAGRFAEWADTVGGDGLDVPRHWRAVARPGG
ncbi:MAG TPA: MFS transporter [Actinophytocola sp.]|uniref:MFS transporter n=1 Tax=Actinophytocola sp. TaxID=1872138 RepID=UPI002DDC93D7|nr:MFS transporter [Actinophytocola sp.]HEV2781516.1 MFS transporter [Actinophytocola sp.]